MGSRNCIGFYVHHHGTGHLTRTLEVVRHMKVPVKILCSSDRPKELPKNVTYIQLPMDIDEQSLKGETPDFLHFSANRSKAINERMRTIADLCQDIRLLVVDVSVEVTLLARLLSIPTIVTYMQGDRNDTAHHLAYKSAEALIAYYPSTLSNPDTPGWIIDKTMYAGCFSKSLGRKPIDTSEAKVSINNEGKIVLVATSLGGSGVSMRSVNKLAKHAPDWQWIIVGLTNDDMTPAGNVCVAGVQQDIWSYLCAADVVIGSGGYNMIMEIGSANKPALLIPEERPFKEQYYNVLTLAKAGIVTMYDSFDDIPSDSIGEILASIQSKTTKWSSILDPLASKKSAEFIEDKYHSLIW